jgi:putative DNA primase/helicase
MSATVRSFAPTSSRRDIDDCRDPASGAIDPWAEKLVAKAGSYVEVTVSGTGLRIIGRATGSKIHRKQPVANGVTLETYRRAERYIVMTGDALPGSSMVLADLDAIMDAVVAELDAGVKHEDPAHHESPVRRLSTRRHIPRHARRSAGSLPVERRWAPNQDQQKRDMEN